MEGFIGQPCLVDPPGSCVPSLRISVCRSSEGHGSDLALDARLEASAEFYHQSPGVRVSGVGDQGQEGVQVVVYRPVSLIIRGALQSVNGVCFRIDRKELTPELLFEVGPGLDRKDAGVRFLAKEVLRPLRISGALMMRSNSAVRATGVKLQEIPQLIIIYGI